MGPAEDSCHVQLPRHDAIRRGLRCGIAELQAERRDFTAALYFITPTESHLSRAIETPGLVAASRKGSNMPSQGRAYAALGCLPPMDTTTADDVSCVNPRPIPIATRLRRRPPRP